MSDTCELLILWHDYYQITISLIRCTNYYDFYSWSVDLVFRFETFRLSSVSFCLNSCLVSVGVDGRFVAAELLPLKSLWGVWDDVVIVVVIPVDERDAAADVNVSVMLAFRRDVRSLRLKTSSFVVVSEEGLSLVSMARTCDQCRRRLSSERRASILVWGGGGLRKETFAMLNKLLKI